MVDEKMKSLILRLLDDRCDLFGVKNTISYLIDIGLTKEDILKLEFDEKDVDYVINNPDAEFDY